MPLYLFAKRSSGEKKQEFSCG